MSPAAATGAIPLKWIRLFVGIVLCSGVWALLFARTMDRDLNHDEHQFLAPAALLSREGLQPWRDYPLFHLPNLVFAYAAADRVTGDLIFGAKLVCFVATAVLTVGLVFGALRTARTAIAIVLAVGVLALLISDPLFRYTAGKTWNHEVPSALLIGAIACMAAAGKRDRLGFSVAAGVLGGLAAGCRLTFAPVLLGLFAFAWVLPTDGKRRALHAGALTLAATLALAPSLFYLVTQREAFIFGNFEFPRLRLLDANDTRAHETVAWWRKLRFFWKEIVRASWPVFLMWAIAGIRPGWRWLRRGAGGDITAAAILICLPFVLLGCFAPSRYQYQHYFVFVPLLAYGILAGVRGSADKAQMAYACVSGFLGLLMMLRASADYASVRDLTHPEQWFSANAAAFGKKVRAEVRPDGRVLTLAPTVALAGGLRIYPELATGAFGWRGAHHVDPVRRKRMHLLAPEDVTSLLSGEKPAGILTGVEEEEEEEALIRWAEEHAYRKIDMRKKRTLWVPTS